MKKTLLLMIAVFTIVSQVHAAGDAEAGKQKSMTCAACHGADGNSLNAEWPKLAQQKADYIVKQLLDYKEGAEGGRNNPIMYGIVSALSEQDMADLGAYFASQTVTIGEADPALVEKGSALYWGGDAAREIPACSACHGPAGLGLNEARFPLLSGQYAEYTLAQLKAFHDGTRHNDLNGMMRDVAAKLTDEDMQALASFIAGLHVAEDAHSH